MRSLHAVLAPIALVATTAGAQVLRGTVREESGRPVPSAVIALLDSVGAGVGVTMTGPAGDYAMRSPAPGRYRLRIQRIGYAPHLTPWVQVRAGESREVAIRLTSTRLDLTAVTIAADGACASLRGPAADSTAVTLWEQASAALQVAIFSIESDLTATTISIDRTLDRRGRRVLSQAVQARTERVVQPWRALDYRALRTYGYAREDADGFVSFMAPGLDAMVSPLFLEDHCLRPQRASDPREVALAFEPTPDRRDRSEVRGTLVVDRATAELRRLQLTFVNVPLASRGLDVDYGAAVEFVRLADGRFIISHWEIRMPRLELPAPTAPRAVVAAVVTAGGEVIAVTRGLDTLFVRPPITVSGTVVDSASGRPVPAARVRLAGVPGEVQADAGGRFTLPDVLLGVYLLEVRTASLDSIGWRHTQELAVTGESRLTVRVSNASAFIAAACGSAMAGAQSVNRGILFGTVRGLGDNLPVAGIRVESDWREYDVLSPLGVFILSMTRGVAARTDSTGAFRLCRVPTEADIWVRAVPDSGRGEWAKVRLEPDQRAAWTALRVDWAGKPYAQFRGIVADSTGIPLAGVEVVLPDANLSARTDSSGTFRIPNVPPGFQRVLVRRIGYAPFETEVAFGEKDEEERRITLSGVTQIAQVTVLSTVLESAIREFEDNRRLGLGSFATRADLARYEGMRTANAVAGFAGLTIVGGGNAKFVKSRRETVTIRRGGECLGPGPSSPGSPVYVPTLAEKRQGIECACYAQVYVDGVLQNHTTPTEPFDLNSIPPEQIEAIEWYASPAETPIRYARLNSSCGVVVIHRRRERP